MRTLNIGRDFSQDPSGRYRSDGSASGEAFREDHLKPAIDNLAPDEKLTIILDDGVEGYGSSFLVEGFGGMVKHGYIAKQALLDKLEFSYTDPEFEFYKNRILQYVTEAKPLSRSVHD